MKEMIRKLYPILLPPLCIIAGVLSIVFFCVGPVGKGQYDILAIGCIAIAAAILQIVLILADHFRKKKGGDK
ncbi:MAG: hypothetical protein K5925_06100 [Bacilli bacterium]|nr:hypothetical protein [Bacilli bacterium]